MNLEKAKQFGLLNDHKNRFPLNIQLFADEGSNEAETDETGGDDDSQSENSEDDTGDDDQGESKSFTQEDVDKAIQKRLARERKKWEQEQVNQQTEAEKLAGMSEAQKKKYQEEKKQRDLETREKEITKRELAATAKEALADKGLPTSLADVLDYTDADSCDASIKKVEKAFQEAVQKEIDKKIQGGEVIKKAKSNSTKTEQDLIYKTMMGN